MALDRRAPPNPGSIPHRIPGLLNNHFGASYAIRVQCCDCLNTCHISQGGFTLWVTNRVSLTETSLQNHIRFCPFCGSTNLVFHPTNSDYAGQSLPVIAESLQMPIKVVATLYANWSPADGDNPNFVDWIKEMRG